MKRRALSSIALLACTAGMAAATDERMAAVQDLAARWTTAYNNGEAAKVAELYAVDATFLSGVLGALKGRQDIEAAISRSVKQLPKITFTAREAHQNGDVLWGYWDYTFADGPSGYGAITAVREVGVWRIAQHMSNVKPKAQQGRHALHLVSARFKSGRHDRAAKAHRHPHTHAWSRISDMTSGYSNPT